ncbi:MAG: SH3 domain-containing protein [Anaerolineae bacterium]|nr:SH3 domain-containing protein [Anaerolineae bacterium]MDQ7037176.1 SH3 domain-containing protein [Anaerolineae bacterium]
MLKARILVFITVLLMLPILAFVVTLPTVVTAQDADVGTPPVPLTPGQPLSGQSIQPTLPYTDCYAPLPIEVGQVIYIESGVNIRSAPSGSSPIVWNTVVNNRDEDGNVIANPLQIIATVLEGPVCDTGTNWWRVTLPGNDGWVSEGRPFSSGGYLIHSSVIARDCASYFELQAGQLADLMLDARVRTEPSLNARVRTVAAAGSPVFVVGGSECVDGIRWWLVRVEVVDVIYEGWMAEGVDGLVWLLPTNLPDSDDGTLCGVALDLPFGQRAYVHSLEEIPRNMRIAPGIESPIMFQLVDGVPFIVVGGPVCRNNLNWWQIEVLSSVTVTGWMAEGSQGVGYWISTINPNEFAR